MVSKIVYFHLYYWGNDSHFDEHIFQMGWIKPPTRIVWIQGCFGIHTYLFPNHQFTNSQLVDVQSNVPSKSTTYPGLNQSKLQPKLATVCSKPPNGRIPESWEIHLRGPGDAWLWLNQPTTFPRCVFFGEMMNPSLSIFFKYIAPPPKKRKNQKNNTQKCVKHTCV